MVTAMKSGLINKLLFLLMRIFKMKANKKYCIHSFHLGILSEEYLEPVKILNPNLDLENDW